MNSTPRERCEIIAEYVIETEATVRAAALHFCISKSTVHKDITHKLRYINRILYEEVKEILEKNKSQRHIRGGEATKNKYKLKREKQKIKREVPYP